MLSKTTIPWPSLIKGVLIKRYKRFLADIKLDSGEIVTAHCPNSGRMTECNKPGSNVYLSYHDNPKRKLKYTWELIKMPASLVGVNTNIPNLLVFNTIKDVLLLRLDLNRDVEVVKLSAETLELYPAQPILYLVNGVANNKLNQPKKAIESLEMGADFSDILYGLKMMVLFY